MQRKNVESETSLNTKTIFYTEDEMQRQYLTQKMKCKDNLLHKDIASTHEKIYRY
ncbi:hypothetical protein HanRHA438_Chr16g0765291 [Helianthus annuus]|nr:hypothetical protein HanRHA438_Chr16g0765291 [Helianthus annuus]